MSTAISLLQRIRNQLAGHNVADDAHLARRLIGELGGVAMTDLAAGKDIQINSQSAAAIENAARRLIQGEPLHRILGAREFYGLKLALSPATLEPRPDTETLVDLVLPFVHETTDKTGCCRILDLGTGSGAIALALLSAEPKAMAIGTDISGHAVETALRNAHAHGLSDRFSGLVSDWYSAVTGTFDLIVSNPPYIATADLARLDRNVREHDPLAALDGGPDGLSPYRVIAAGGLAHLAEDGMIGVETGFDQRKSVDGLFAGHGFCLVEARRDLGGNDRAMLFAPPGVHAAPNKKLGMAE